MELRTIHTLLFSKVSHYFMLNICPALHKLVFHSKLKKAASLGIRMITLSSRTTSEDETNLELLCLLFCGFGGASNRSMILPLKKSFTANKAPNVLEKIQWTELKANDLRIIIDVPTWL